jgi:hypothetical protein
METGWVPADEPWACNCRGSETLRNKQLQMGKMKTVVANQYEDEMTDVGMPWWVVTMHRGQQRIRKSRLQDDTAVARNGRK